MRAAAPTQPTPTRNLNYEIPRCCNAATTSTAFLLQQLIAHLAVAGPKIQAAPSGKPNAHLGSVTRVAVAATVLLQDCWAAH